MRAIVCAAAACLFVTPACASSLENVGTDVAIAMPVLAAGIAWSHDQDWDGVGQLSLDTIATVGVAYGLKHVIHEQRPDKSDFQSMPSDTAALAFAPAAFLWDRYGWQWGVPAYAAAAFVGYTRVDAKKHHWYDIAASAGLAWGFSRIFTSEYHRRYNVYSGLYASPEGAFVKVDVTF